MRGCDVAVALGTDADLSPNLVAWAPDVRSEWQIGSIYHYGSLRNTKKGRALATEFNGVIERRRQALINQQQFNRLIQTMQQQGVTPDAIIA